MSEQIYQPDTRQNLLLAALAAAAASIPLPVNLNSIALILLVIVCAFQQPLPELKRRLSEPSLWMIPAIYFIWLCCTYFWDATGGFGMHDIERYAMLLFVPPALAVIPRISLKYLRITAAIFIGVTICVCIGCLIKSWQDYQLTGDSRLFYYHYLSQQMGLNAVFLSNYCLAAITWLLYNAFILNGRTTVFSYLLTLLLCLFLFGMILLLSSKLILLLSLLFIVFLSLYIGYRKKVFLRSLLVIVVFAGVGLVCINQLGYLKWRLSETSLKKYSGPADDNNGLSIRLLMWRTAWDLVKQRPMLGYGVKGAR